GHAFAGRAMGLEYRGITLFLFGGVAELADEPPTAASEFIMAIAGPIVSAVLAGIFWGLALVTPVPWLAYAFLSVAVINAVVLVFNLVPAFPLDGGRVLRSILWGLLGSLRRSTRWASLLGQGFAWVLILLGVFRLFWGADILGGMWSILIGMFLNNAARASYQQVVLRQALEGEPVRRFMNPQPVVVPPTLDLARWVEDYVYRHHRKAFPVASDGRLEGYITTQALANIPRGEWAHHTVGEVMRHDLDALSIAPDADAMDALGKMQRTGLSRLLVTEGGRLVGIVSLKDLLRFLSLKMELEGEEKQNLWAPRSVPRPAPHPEEHVRP
ncbi:MAG TPA: site-2 protease family protein, partial [Gemmataceae bacterium]|nr:site-2 protease family protein [Gemmataceae bacterium]